MVPKVKKKIFLTGSNGRIGSFLEKKLKKYYTVISSDISNGNNLADDAYLKSVFSKNKIYAIVFCHGYNSTPLHKSLLRNSNNFDEMLIKKFFNINFFLNLNVIKNYIKFQKKGRIMNLTSLYSINTPKHFIYKNFSKELGYCVSKSASNMMMKYFGTKYGRKYLFNNIVLGGVKQKGLSSFFEKNYNKNNPVGRMMNLEEIYPVINFLLDEKNTHTNAQEIIVDGGWLSW
jgi:NAD(P)-dependent dehydrogenase (short-subunit alcohol dehydrogenase family)